MPADLLPVVESTWRAYARPGEDPSNPLDVDAVRDRYIVARYGGSPTYTANPYLRCDQCTAWVAGFSGLYEEGRARNLPCGHGAGATSACPSWSPVDGCRCLEQLGSVEHGQP